MMQKGFERNPQQAPKYWQNVLRLGKVIRSNPEAKTVDVTMVNAGAIFYDVPVLCPMVSTSSGESYLPNPHNPKSNTEEGYDFPIAYEKRDIFAVIGFIEGVGSMPVVLGFQHPEETQLSFPDSVGANHHIIRHESDRYHRITGDTVEDFGGDDVSGEEEIRYPDDSYFRVVKKGGSRALTDLSGLNRDADTQPFVVKKEDRKEFYFQHASGTRVHINSDGEVKIGHHTGTWFSIGASTAIPEAESVEIESVDSLNEPPTAAPTSAAQVHIEHSSGTKITIDATGKITIVAINDVVENVTSNMTATVGSAVQIKCPAVAIGADGATHRQVGDTRLVDLLSSIRNWLATHTHNSGSAPDGAPPTVPAYNDVCSVNTTIS